MKSIITIKIIAAFALFMGASGTSAHELNGLHAVHWHTTDTLGFIVVAALAGAAIWLSRK